MTTDEILDAATENLSDTFNAILRIAKQPDYVNGDTKELGELFTKARNQFLLVFTLKNAFRDLSTKA